MADETPQPALPPDPAIDPLLQQAERLPAFLRGTDGDAQHVLPVDGDEEPLADPDDMPFGSEGIVDPSTLTAD